MMIKFVWGVEGEIRYIFRFPVFDDDDDEDDGVVGGKAPEGRGKCSSSVSRHYGYPNQLAERYEIGTATTVFPPSHDGRRSSRHWKKERSLFFFLFFWVVSAQRASETREGERACSRSSCARVADARKC